MNLHAIKVSEEVKAALTKIKGRKTEQEESNFSYNQVIEMLIRSWQEKSQNKSVLA